MELVQKTIGGCLKETAAKVGQQTAIEFGDWSCTWSELDDLHRACLLCTRSELL